MKYSDCGIEMEKETVEGCDITLNVKNNVDG